LVAAWWWQDDDIMEVVSGWLLFAFSMMATSENRQSIFVLTTIKNL
jgi:hypothetical protein